MWWNLLTSIAESSYAWVSSLLQILQVSVSGSECRGVVDHEINQSMGFHGEHSLLTYTCPSPHKAYLQQTMASHTIVEIVFQYNSCISSLGPISLPVDLIYFPSYIVNFILLALIDLTFPPHFKFLPGNRLQLSDSLIGNWNLHALILFILRCS